MFNTQVKRPGATDASVNISEEDAAMIARMRKPVWLIVFVGSFIGLFVWPLLSLPVCPRHEGNTVYSTFSNI